MKLYVCYGTFDFGTHGDRLLSLPRRGGHPCSNAHQALVRAGHRPEVVRSYGLANLPAIFNRTRGRREAKRLTGNYWLPLLVQPDGSWIQGSAAIIDWASAHPIGSA